MQRHQPHVWPQTLSGAPARPTTCTPVMDDIYGGVLALSDFIREDYLQSSTLDPQRAYILHNCIDTARSPPARHPKRCARSSALPTRISSCSTAGGSTRTRASIN